MWRFRTGAPTWHDVLERYGSWSRIYDRFRLWTSVGLFQHLMEEMTVQASTRGGVDLDLVSMDSTITRAHHHSAGLRVDPDLLADLDKVLAEEKGIRQPNGTTS